MLHERQGLPSWRKLREEECRSVSCPGGFPGFLPIRDAAGVGRGWGWGAQEERLLCGLRSGHQGTGCLRILAPLPWGRLPAQCPVTDRTTLRTVSWSLSLRSVPELRNSAPGRFPAKPLGPALTLGSSSFGHWCGFSAQTFSDFTTAFLRPKLQGSDWPQGTLGRLPGSDKSGHRGMGGG